MKTSNFKVNIKYILSLVMIFILMGCQKFSEKVTDPEAGLNGSFEITKNGLPVNWLLYTPKTVPDADFDIILDKSDFKDGLQSLKYDVRSCSSTRGWRSPGFTNEFFDLGKFEGEATFKLSFWIKNEAAKYSVSAGGVSSHGGKMKTLVERDGSLEDWEYFEFDIDVPKEMHLRMQFNVLEPGKMWIDDIQINKV